MSQEDGRGYDRWQARCLNALMELRVRLVSKGLTRANIEYDVAEIRNLLTIYPMQHVFDIAKITGSRKGWIGRIVKLYHKLKTNLMLRLKHKNSEKI